MDYPIGKIVIIRSYDSGVHFGELADYDAATRHAKLSNTRRIHYWDGAASLSELAGRGTSKPNECRFTAAISEIIVANVIEIIPATDTARANIEAVPIWTR